MTTRLKMMIRVKQRGMFNFKNRKVRRKYGTPSQMLDKRSHTHKKSRSFSFQSAGHKRMNLTFLKNRFQLNTRKKISLKIRGVCQWNELPGEVIGSSSTGCVQGKAGQLFVGDSLNSCRKHGTGSFTQTINSLLKQITSSYTFQDHIVFDKLANQTHHALQMKTDDLSMFITVTQTTINYINIYMYL